MLEKALIDIYGTCQLVVQTRTAHAYSTKAFYSQKKHEFLIVAYLFLQNVFFKNYLAGIYMRDIIGPFRHGYVSGVYQNFCIVITLQQTQNAIIVVPAMGQRSKQISDLTGSHRYTPLRGAH